MQSHKSVSFFLFLLSCLLCGIVPSFAQAETLVPLYIEKGTNLTHIARTFCNTPSDWKTIAKVNKLTSPFLILANSTLQIPLSILRTKNVSAFVASTGGSPQLITADSRILDLHKGDHILPGQTVVTRKGEYVHLIYPDHKHTRIGPQSELTLIYLMRLADGSLKAHFSLEKGRITHSIQQKLKANETFNTQTAIAITGIRGTEFRLKVQNTESNIIETLRGKVSLAAAGKQLVLNKGMGSMVKKGQPPEPPRKLPVTPETPDIKNVYRLLPVVITAPEHKNAHLIRLRVTTDAEGQITLLEQVARPGEEFSLPNLKDGSYHIFFTAIDDKGFESTPSHPAFLCIRTSPSAPLLISPKNGSQVFESKTILRWMDSDLARLYKFQLATDSDFSTIIDEQETKENSYTTTHLNPGLFFFRVKLIAEDGFETLFSLPVNWEVMAQPTLGKTGSIIKGENGILLQWRAVPRMAGYMIQIAEDSSFDNLIISKAHLKEPSFTIQKHLAPGTYYIRVASVTEKGSSSPWSHPRTLAIDSTSPGIMHYLIALGIAALILL